MHYVGVWPDICSLSLSLIVLLFSSGVGNYMGDWAAQHLDPLIFQNSAVTLTRSIGMISLGGTSCQVYHCLSTLDILSAITMFLWSLLCVINNFEHFEHLKPKVIYNKYILKVSILLYYYLIFSSFSFLQL